MLLDALLIALLVFLLFSTAFWTYLLVYLLWYRVPLISTRQPIIQAALKLADIQPGQQVVELGCGWAPFLFTAQAAHPQASYQGLDVLWPVIAYNRWRANSKITFKKTNFFNEDLSQADVIYCYLWDTVMEQIYRQKWSELKTGAKLISYDFPLKDLQPQHIVKDNGSHLYLYVKG